ncbi:MAG: hypothetical protein HPY65_09520 [Syntrophaceae bacterium]|nr:hypothetical protein [Syntrophaceae bacterium]
MNEAVKPDDQAVSRSRERDEALWRRETLAALGGMAEEVAHQIRNPLGSIELTTNLLLRDWLGEKDQRRLKRILSCVREIEGRISSLLSASWVYGFSLRPVRVHELLGEIFQSSEAFMDGDETFLEIRYGAGDPVIRGDRPMLKHLLVQMVLKMLSGSSAGGRLVVETESPVPLARGGESVWAAIRFRLFGPGEMRPSNTGIRGLFRERSSEHGVFLAVIRNIVEAHRGIIRFVDDDASGLSLVLYLPCVRDADSAGRFGPASR